MPTRTALVTGGTSGIGRATALALHARGARVAVTGQNPDSLARARAEFPEGVVVLEADVRSLAAIDQLVERLRTDFGTLDTLFLNAGITNLMPLESWTEQAYDEMFAINTKGAFFTLTKTLPILSDGASVIITGGIVSSRGMPGGSVTGGSHGALLTMLPSLALELAPRGIRVNVVSPGAIDTPIWGKGGWAPEVVSGTLANMGETIPLKRIGSAEDIAETVAFLASDGSAYITGQEVTVAGGMGLGA